MLKPIPQDTDHSAALGRDLRALRKSRGLTLNELAIGIGRSVGFLSQIERGLSAPSINDLRALAKAFEVPVSWFFLTDEGDEAEREYIVRAGNRRALGTTEEGIIEELLSPDLGGSFEMFQSTIQPRTEQTEMVYRETEEAGYLVSGQIDLWIEDQKFSLTAGDSFRFDHKPVRWHNTGDELAVIIWVVSPPVY
ncbi:MAG: helix-turn-helix domain-containing protein [Rhodobacteraceae bacterium]|nr:helix-turn-helix domain-containing protein [Paracoccaceae bacterium]